MVAPNFSNGLILALSATGAEGLKPCRFDNGVPVYRFRVEAMPTGRFLTADNQPFDVTAPTLEHWQKTFKAFSNRGIPVPVLTGTHLEPTAEHSVGRVIDLSNDGRRLWATVELVGADAPRLAASNSVSIYAAPQWTDTYGNTYHWPIRHLLLTPDPRIPGLKGFVPLAASNGQIINIPVLRYENMAASTRKAPPRALALDQLGAMNEDGLGVPGVGDGAALPESSTAGDLNAASGGKGGTKALKEHIKHHFLDKAHTVLDDEQLEHEEKLEAIQELLLEMERILEAFQDEEEGGAGEGEGEGEADSRLSDPEHEEGPRGAAMSNLGATSMPQLRRQLGCANAQLAQLTSRLRRNEITTLFNSGKINKLQHDQLLNQFCNPQHVALSLSNEAFGNSFDQAIALLSANEEGLYGERTGPQGLPGGKPIALNNPYIQTGQDIETARKEDESMTQPSSTRVSRNGRR